MRRTSAWVQYRDIRELIHGIELHVPQSLPSIFVHLPEDEMFLNYASDSGVAPNVPVQDLTGEFRFVLYIDHKPAIIPDSAVLCLQLQTSDCDESGKHDNRSD